jgi:SAM-dependent methyltransferase
MDATLNVNTSDNAMAAAICQWPEEFFYRLRERMLTKQALHSDALAELVRQGVISEPGYAPTALGAEVRDILLHESWIEGDELAQMLSSGAIDAGESVLDVGCSTGWMLRRLPRSATAHRVGVDVDVPALALGYRYAQLEGQAIQFHACSAHALPFESGAFDWVLCRNALTYMHQKTALREMMRVLRPGGRMFLRVENPLFDLLALVESRSPVMIYARLRDLFWGTLSATVGYQPMPGGLLNGSRAFTSQRRLRKLLRGGSCRVVRKVQCLKCPTLMGRPTQTAVVVHKAPVPVEADLSPVTAAAALVMAMS